VPGLPLPNSEEDNYSKGNFIEFGLPDKLVETIKAAGPFNFFEEGSNALPGARQYVSDINDKTRYYGEVDQAGQRCGKRIMFGKDVYDLILEGFWLNSRLDGLGKYI
jgi:hypothetical protein